MEEYRGELLAPAGTMDCLKAAIAAGAPGLMTEIHDDPAHAFVDGAQALTPAEFSALADKARRVREVVQADLVAQ